MENKQLQEEAEEYAKQTFILYSETSTKVLTKEEDKKECIEDFIAGATSKYVEQEKLKFAIEQLSEIDKNCFGGSNTCKAKIKKLEQQLKELEK